MESTTQPFVVRLMHRFRGYTVVGCSTFLLDIAIVATLYFWFGTQYAAAITVGFLIGVTINYTLCHQWVYCGTRRKFADGLLFFVLLAFLGVALITYTTGLLTEHLGYSLLFARVLVGMVAGGLNFLANTFANFQLV